MLLMYGSLRIFFLNTVQLLSITFPLQPKRNSMPLESINPTNGELIQPYQEHLPEEIEQSLVAADDAFMSCRRVSFAERANYLKTAAEILRTRKEDYGKLMALEMGKPLAQGIAEAEKCAWVCDYYAENAERFLSPEIIPTDATKSYVTFQPLGILLAVMPWNFPFWQVFRAAAPALMSGNPVVLKHASNVSGCALEIERVFRDAGLPDGLFKTFLLKSSLLPLNNSTISPFLLCVAPALFYLVQSLYYFLCFRVLYPVGL
jgi:succinate-semialdehyde dehydrogenase/glutarate-semialdehyde dehydrogenase